MRRQRPACVASPRGVGWLTIDECIAECIVGHISEEDLGTLSAVDRVSRVFHAFAGPRLKELKAAGVMWIEREPYFGYMNHTLWDRVKVCFTGPALSGKTCVIERIVNGRFFEEYTPTLWFQISRATASFQTRPIDMEFWGWLFDELDWLMERRNEVSPEVKVRNSSLKYYAQEPQTILCGNKVDVKDRGPKGVTREQGVQMAKENGFDAFIEVSAMTSRNIPQLRWAILQLFENVRSTHTPTKKQKCAVM
ncbi:hypothetical protein Pelo_8418 [Pelomyxa schiedti]|nr:hypothetical protein Pelo_8418 [Pelomyxa schiedti]